ncbi:MAG: hypothetical protein JJU15_08920 [Pararhodobacter sp.]|nr:hypothetical protein [Pararhodobacter sp.]
MKIASVMEGSRRIGAGLVLAAGMMLAGGAEASTEWRGGGFVSDFQNCENNGWPTGFSEPVRARYRPSDLPGNSDFTRLTLLFHNGADNYRTRGGRFANQFREVDGVAIWSGGWVYDPHPMLRLQQHQPQNINERTNRIRLVGQIRHFNGLRGCRVRFDLTLTRRPQ